MYGLARRAAADGMGSRLAAGLRRLEAGAHRQRRLRPASARRLWRGCSTRSIGAPAGLAASDATAGGWRCTLVAHLEKSGRSPTMASGKCAGARRHFTHSKVMAWVAFDRAVRSVEEFGLEGPRRRWRDAARRNPRRSLRARASTPSGIRFVQLYGASEARRQPAADPAWSASCPPTIRACKGTVAAIERDLYRDGFVASLPTPQTRRRRLAAGRRRLPRLQFLAGRQLCSARAARRSAGAVRAPDGPAQRRRAAGGGIRSGRQAAAWQFPPGAFASGDDQFGA